MKKKILLIILTAFILLFLYFIPTSQYIHIEISTQIDSLIQSQKSMKSKSIQSDKRTQNFFKSLGHQYRLKNLSDSEGGSKNELYYVGEISNKNIDSGY